MAEQVPLAALLPWAWVAFTIEAGNAAEAAGAEHERIGRLFRIPTPIWANGLRFVDDEGITVAGLLGQALTAVTLAHDRGSA